MLGSVFESAYSLSHSVVEHTRGKSARFGALFLLSCRTKRSAVDDVFNGLKKLNGGRSLKHIALDTSPERLFYICRVRVAAHFDNAYVRPLVSDAACGLKPV